MGHDFTFTTFFFINYCHRFVFLTWSLDISLIYNTSTKQAYQGGHWYGDIPNITAAAGPQVWLEKHPNMLLPNSSGFYVSEQFIFSKTHANIKGIWIIFSYFSYYLHQTLE